MKSSRSKSAATPEARTFKELKGRDLLEDMEAYRREVTATPEAALAFLRRIGVVDKRGRTRRLVRD